MVHRKPRPLTAGVLMLAAAAAWAEGQPTPLDPVQVTATRQAEPISKVPASLSIVTGDELRARGANDLRTALSLVAGVEGTPTGDGGPAGSVPALWGLREADAFLLVVDGVPWGGAFNPATPAIDLTGVERIEVLRGAAPVMYGATSFSGVIHIIHYAAGEILQTLSAGGGSYGSLSAAATTRLPAIGGYQQSLSANLEKRGFSVDREEYNRYHLLYRGASKLEVGSFHVDADVSILPQTPGSVTFRNGATLRTDLIPVDANHNPADARLDQKRVNLTAGFDSKRGFGDWSTTLSLTRTTDDIVRGFLRDNAPMVDAMNNDADGYTQKRQITDVYFDTHLVQNPAETISLTYGLDYLYGKGKQNAQRFGYFASLDGSKVEASAQGDKTEFVRLDDERGFAGLYAQLDWQALPDLDVLTGVRLNRTAEKTEGEGTNDPLATDKRTKTRASGVIGASWHVFREGNNALTLYTDYRNTYKPLAIDFGPEPDAAILQPETSNSYEAGAKGVLADGRLSYDLSLFQLDFKNLKTVDAGGATVNAGKTRFKGAEIETRCTLMGALQLAANYSYHDSRFVSFRRGGGASGIVDGNRFELAPFHLAGLGLLYTPPQGLNATLVSNYTGERRLNKSNSLSAGGYVTLDASLGYDYHGYGVHVNGYNLNDRRVPIAESELSGKVSGASSYYLLPGRTVMVNFTAHL